ncbi:MAG: patatin-like phospholipase family protein [Muribaculaceae bacterium]|nr:patatin-like phospholipase family protein [Muribaculaceae bacterium]
MDSENKISAVKALPGDPGVRIGVALSGGGARGFAHAGALAAIEEAGLRPDVLAGVSAGSVVAVLYSAGMPPERFTKIFSEHSFRDFVKIHPKSTGLFDMSPFGRFVQHHAGRYRRLEELPIPVYVGTTNFDRGCTVVFNSGDLAPRVMASCCIPIVFQPIVIDGEQYVDGGVLRNHPAWILRDKCDFLIGINVSPLNRKEKDDTLLSIAMRSYHLMAKANQAEDMALCDLNIQTSEISSYKPFDLRSIENVYLSGYLNTRKVLRDAGLWKRNTPNSSHNNEN